MAKRAKWPPRHGHGHTVKQSTTISTTFHHKGLQIALPKFEDDLINSLGGVKV